MQLDLKDSVTRVVYYTLNLLEEIQDNPHEVDPRECREIFLGMLKAVNEAKNEGETAASIQYALTAWVDELLSRAPWPHAVAWNARPLEEELFGTTCRKWRFFEQAEAALARYDWAALSVFQFCVKFGFRGIYGKDRVKVRLNDRLPMARARSKAARPVPMLAGMLREEASGVSSWSELESATLPAAPSGNLASPGRGTFGSPTGPVLPPTLAAWCRTTFWALGETQEKGLKISRPFRLLRRSLPEARIITEWAIVMAIGVLLSVVFFAMGH